MAGLIVFDHVNGESQLFHIGKDTIYFWVYLDQEASPPVGILVAQANGEPYSRTNQYIRFATHEDAERFLVAAQQEGGLPHGW